MAIAVDKTTFDSCARVLSRHTMRMLATFSFMTHFVCQTPTITFRTAVCHTANLPFRTVGAFWTFRARNFHEKTNRKNQYQIKSIKFLLRHWQLKKESSANQHNRWSKKNFSHARVQISSCLPEIDLWLSSTVEIAWLDRCTLTKIDGKQAFVMNINRFCFGVTRALFLRKNNADYGRFLK